jgi:hypothetical protein
LKSVKLLFVAALSTLLTGSLFAAPAITEGFEAYHLGALDANNSGSPNNSSIIATNPWAGPLGTNCQVASAELSTNGVMVTPHNGTKMVRGDYTQPYADADYYNLAYALHATNNDPAIMGNIYLDWWFFDSVGQGTNSTSPFEYDDFIALCFYGDFNSEQIYPPGLNVNGIQDQPTARISIGGTSSLGAGFNPTNYQTLDLNQPGYDGGGAINLPVARSVGWHHARIEVSSPQGTNSAVNVSLYIDDLTKAAYQFTSVYADGFNCIEMNTLTGQITAYYDDISVGYLPPATLPTLSITNIGANNVVLTWTSSSVLQSSPDLKGTNFADVVDSHTNFVTSPYTNAIAAGMNKFFRLRN